MRRLTYLVLALATLYGGYWFIARATFLAQVENGLSHMQDDGWAIAYEDLSIIGFPSRFDVTADRLSAASPDRSFQWDAPFFQALMLSYRPNEVIAVWPESQSFTLRGAAFDLAARGLRASLSVNLDSSASLSTATLESAPLLLSGANDWSLGAESILLALRETPNAAAAATYDLYLSVEGLTLPDTLRQQIDPTGQLPSSFGKSTVDVTFKNAAPIALNGATGAVQKITLNSAQIVWGGFRLSGSGALTIIANGIPEGRIDLDIQDWERLITIAEALGWIDAGVVPTWRNMAQMLSGGSDTLTLPLAFQNGFMSIGPIPLGPAPRF